LLLWQKTPELGTWDLSLYPAQAPEGKKWSCAAASTGVIALSNTADIDTLVAYVVLVTTQRGIARYFRHRYHLLSALPLETADLVKCSAKTCTGLTHHNGPPELNCLLCCF
jgi:hypothetical protein